MALSFYANVQKKPALNSEKASKVELKIDFFRILVPFSGLFPGHAYYYLRPLFTSRLYFLLALDRVVWDGLGPPDDVSGFLLGSSIIQNTVALCAALLLYGFSTLA